MLKTMSPRPGFLPVKNRLDRRAAVRYPCSLETACNLPMAEELEAHGLLVEVRDVSTGGIGLILDRDCPKGLFLEIELHNLIQGFKTTLEARVVHTVEQSDGTWFVGCSFLRPMSEHELKSWL